MKKSLLFILSFGVIAIVATIAFLLKDAGVSVKRSDEIIDSFNTVNKSLNTPQTNREKR